MRKKVVFFIGIIFLCVALYAMYLYNKPHTSVAAIAPAYNISAAELFAAYNSNEAAANQQFLAKVIQVKGNIRDIIRTDSTLTVMLESGDIAGGVSCNVITKDATANKELTTGMPISIKGRCSGFLADVMLADCAIVE